jgi:CubicO group peptidase (beta-lactamase class C family)
VDLVKKGSQMTIQFVHHRKWQSWLAVYSAALVLASSGCARNPHLALQSPTEARGDETHLPRAAPSEVGVDADLLEQMVRNLHDSKRDIDAVLVLRHGKVVLEAYAYPHRPTDRHNLFSCTKSVISMLTGIAISEGKVPGVEARVVDLFPEWNLARGDALKGRITLRDLLTMQSGLEWNQGWVHGMPDPDREVYESSDSARYILEKPMRTEPGTTFYYTNSSSHLIGAVVQKVTSKPLAEYAEEKLFRPLGIEGAAWWKTQDGRNTGGWGLFLRPEDMAKLGQLFLDGGRWNGRQVVPAAWVDESTRKWAETPSASQTLGYGYQWWRTEWGYMAQGSGGQFIFVNPDQDLVAVFFSALPGFESWLPHTLMEKYIVPAADAVGSSAADERLLRAVADFDRKPTSRPLPLPAIASSLNGARFALEDGSRLGIAFPGDGEAVARLTSSRGECVFRIGLDGVPRVNTCYPRSGTPGLPASGPAALIGWFEDDLLKFRQAAVDESDDLVYQVALATDRIEISASQYLFGDNVIRTTGTRER